MDIHFTKYHGTGNDFILIDNRSNQVKLSESQIQSLCDRHFGIGADGLILIEKHKTQDYKMVYYNADGSQSLCGNGSRCGFAFARSLGLADQTASFETTDGVHPIKIEDGNIHFGFPDLKNSITLYGEDKYLNTGSPHYIKVVQDVKSLDVEALGREIRNMSEFSGQNGTNVNFVQLLKGKVKIRTYERGVEAETLSCGTGATAVGLVASEYGYDSPVEIETEGGILTVSYRLEDGFFKNVWLAGPAQKVFEGTVTI